MSKSYQLFGNSEDKSGWFAAVDGASITGTLQQCVAWLKQHGVEV